MTRSGNAGGDNWVHSCGAFLSGTTLADTDLCWWCGRDITQSVPMSDVLHAARILGGGSAVRDILRTMPDIGPLVPAETTIHVHITPPR